MCENEIMLIQDAYKSLKNNRSVALIEKWIDVNVILIHWFTPKLKIFEIYSTIVVR